jgi:broad specificity phosphatase PhoE
MDDPPGDRPLSDPPSPSAIHIPAEIEASIVLLRHGESVHITEGRFQGQADSPLSPLGERQAALAAARLARPGERPALPIGPPSSFATRSSAKPARRLRSVRNVA